MVLSVDNAMVLCDLEQAAKLLKKPTFLICKNGHNTYTNSDYVKNKTVSGI